MFHDEKRFQMTRPPEDYDQYSSNLSEEQKTALSRIGNENSKFLLEEYVRRLKNEDDPLIYITDFMSWIDQIMIIYDANTYFDKRDEEIEKLMRGEYEPGPKEKS
jgi:hypothetical protein